VTSRHGKQRELGKNLRERGFFAYHGGHTEQADYNCAESVCSLFEKTMRINNGLRGSSLRQTIEQFHEARLVRITDGGFAI